METYGAAKCPDPLRLRCRSCPLPDLAEMKIREQKEKENGKKIIYLGISNIRPS